MMFGIPLHPLVVHFPIVLVVLLPIFVLAALWAVRKGTTPRRAWAVPMAAAAALTVSSWVATQTGESQEDKVEAVVSKGALHEHEESAERFLMLSGVLLVVAAGGFARGTVGRAARYVTAAGAVGLVAAGALVGHSGGLLVYRHGAASAYAAPSPDGTRDVGRADDDAPTRVAQRDRPGREDH
ncbi:MAG: hypothetical protein K0S86_2258 [Geminicoccaceae bacterium]|nr:hypothetical protein [Geminicoccaceae bacterium]